jgi:hypothetical protein
MAHAARAAVLATGATNEQANAEAAKTAVEAIGGVRTGQHNNLD